MDTFGTLKAEVLAWLDESDNTDTTETNVENALNQAQAQRLSETNWPFMLWDTPVTFSLVASQQDYALHQEFGRIYYVYNRTSQAFMREVPMRQLPDLGSDWNTSASGNAFALWGRTPVQTQPTSASVITIVSSSASDTTSAKAITIRGETTNGITTESITPTGTTSAAGSTSFSRILGVTKAAAWAGTLTMTSNSAAVTNLKLFPTELGRSYQRFRLLFLPGTTDTIEYRFFRKPTAMSAANDLPDIPPPFAKILVWDALLLMASYDNKIETNRIEIWRDNQQRLLQSMQQTFLEGQSLEVQPRMVRFVES